jgi:hypothetical protein
MHLLYIHITLFTYFSFCDGFFSVFFYACASQFYDASFFYRKAYSDNFLILIINKFIPFRG